MQNEMEEFLVVYSNGEVIRQMAPSWEISWKMGLAQRDPGEHITHMQRIPNSNTHIED